MPSKLRTVGMAGEGGPGFGGYTVALGLVADPGRHCSRSLLHPANRGLPVCCTPRHRTHHRTASVALTRARTSRPDLQEINRPGTQLFDDGGGRTGLGDSAHALTCVHVSGPVRSEGSGSNEL